MKRTSKRNERRKDMWRKKPHLKQKPFAHREAHVLKIYLKFLKAK